MSNSDVWWWLVWCECGGGSYMRVCMRRRGRGPQAHSQYSRPRYTLNLKKHVPYCLQVKRYSCNSTDSLVASVIAPGALFQCGAGVLSNQSAASAAGAVAKGAPVACEVGLTGDGNPIYCHAAECTVKNASMVVCRSLNCSCVGGCSVGDAGACRRAS